MCVCVCACVVGLVLFYIIIVLNNVIIQKLCLMYCGTLTVAVLDARVHFEICQSILKFLLLF